jgi:hypothetical protein
VNDSNQKLVRDAVKVTGDYLKDKLVANQFHKVRNSYAHVWERIKWKFGMSYKECTDEQTVDIIIFIKGLENE